MFTVLLYVTVTNVTFCYLNVPWRELQIDKGRRSSVISSVKIYLNVSPGVVTLEEKKIKMQR